MIRPACGLALALLALAGCTRRHPPVQPTPAHYVVGDGYELDGTWYYPREQTRYEATGLAAIAPDHRGLTADGETFDATALTAAHQTLQLPAIARVTNLENGRQILLRLNDRGPASPGRLLALSPHAATLLEAAEGTQVRLQLDEEMTRTLAEQIGGGPHLDVAAAPRDAVQAEPLAPPSGAARSGRGANAPGATPASLAPAAGAAVPDRMPEVILQGPAEPGQIILRASEFGRIDYAQRLASRLYGLSATVETVQEGRSHRYRVRAGPFASVAEADAAMAQARRAGILDARLVVE